MDCELADAMFQLAFLQMHGEEFPGILHYVSRIPPGECRWFTEMADMANRSAKLPFRSLIHRGLQADLESTLANYAIQSITEDMRVVRRIQDLRTTIQGAIEDMRGD